MNEADIKKWTNKILRWRREPWLFAYEILGVQELDPGQIEILKAYADPRIEKIAVKASTGTGKTFVEAVIVHHFISCYGSTSNPAKGILTSIDGQNMEANLWAEISRLYNGSEYMKQFFGLHSEKLFNRKYPMDWFVERRTWDKKADSGPHQDALGLAGHHSKYSLYLVDESGGVPKGVVSAGERTLVNKPEGCFLKLIQMGNPTNKEGPLWDAFHEEKKMWATYTMTSDPDDPNRSRRADEKWCRDLIDTYGRDYPYVQVYVLGEFPSQDFNAFLSIDDVEAAMNRDYEQSVYDAISGRLGCDMSYEGDDKSFGFPRKGLKAFDPTEFKVSLASPTIGFDMAKLAMPLFGLLDLEDCFVDATGGYGNAFMEALRINGRQAIPVKFNAKSITNGFANIRAEMYWNMSRWVKNGGALPRVAGLAEELCATKYTIDKKQNMLAEPKEIVKKRIKKSPNMADSLVTTFAIPDKASMRAKNSGLATGPIQGMEQWDGLKGFKTAPRNQPKIQGFGGGYGRQ
ncbi:MAG: hypothetical protein KGL39_19835 [Patescibacteria group bacterium]|nr:hypothetical protein [Patescibacteria group bacterium]